MERNLNLPLLEEKWAATPPIFQEPGEGVERLLTCLTYSRLSDRPLPDTTYQLTNYNNTRTNIRSNPRATSTNTRYNI
jgi:hypothetical protein